MRSTTFKTVRWIAGFTLACVITLSACSSSGNKSDSGNPGSSSNGAASSTTVTLGLLTSLTGPLSSEFGQPTVAAAQARIDLANHTNAARVSQFYAAGAQRLSSYGQAIETLNARQVQFMIQFEY